METVRERLVKLQREFLKTHRFRVWKEDSYWWWKCTMCEPPTVGKRRKWQGVIDVAIPRHMDHRYFHHARMRNFACGKWSDSL